VLSRLDVNLIKLNSEQQDVHIQHFGGMFLSSFAVPDGLYCPLALVSGCFPDVVHDELYHKGTIVCVLEIYVIVKIWPLNKFMRI